MEDRRSSRFMSSSMPLGLASAAIEHHEISQGIDHIDAVRIERADALRQQRQQWLIGRACANHDQIRMRRQKFLQVAAVAIADEDPLHAIHFAIERQTHLARVI